MEIVVGSENPAKIDAVKNAFGAYFDNLQVTGIYAPSHVTKNPENDEIFKGAFNRADIVKEYCIDECIEASYYVGLEGGLKRINGQWGLVTACCIISPSRVIAPDNVIPQKISYGESPVCQVPEFIFNRVHKGEDIGSVIDEITKKANSNTMGGAIELFSKGLIDRREFSYHAVVMALFPHVNDELYSRSQ